MEEGSASGQIAINMLIEARSGTHHKVRADRRRFAVFDLPQTEVDDHVIVMCGLLNAPS